MVCTYLTSLIPLTECLSVIVELEDEESRLQLEGFR